MTERDLSTLLREHVHADEPALSLTPDVVILGGRRAVRRRRNRRTALSVAIIGTAAAVLPVLLPHGSGAKHESRIDPQTAAALANYRAGAMPNVILGAIGPVVDASAPDIRDQYSFTAADDQGTRLPERYWDKASSMQLAFGGQGKHRVRVELLHARSEAEGDARKGCAEDLTSGYAFSCEVTNTAGDLVTVRVVAVRALDASFGSPGWSAVTRAELRTGTPVATDPNQNRIDPDDVYFIRSVKSVHSETFLTVAEETVKAPTFAAATTAFTVPVAALVDVVSDPSLVIPKPPAGENGCPWLLHPEGISCSARP